MLEKVTLTDNIKSQPPHSIEQNGQQQPGPAYRERAARLRPELIRCWWVHHSSASVPIARVLPDNCADFIVRNDGKAWLVGPATGADIFHTEGANKLRAIRINPAALGAVSGIDAAELVDQRADFDQIFPLHVAQRLATAIWSGDEPLVLQIFSDAQPTARIGEGFRLLEKYPHLDVEAIADRLGHSPRNFRRMIKLHAGLAPKVIQRVSRFRSFIAAAESANEAINLAALAQAHGYADQAHLSRESLALGGLPPRALLAERESA
ncbi:MAG: DUF6597 domain-containing transcriptional factor [Antricoccus sp.]